jgi:CRP/FNR family transcriptional regulator, cyclic AMP receptor protein
MHFSLQVIPRKKTRIMTPTEPMKSPYGLQVIEACTSCPVHSDRLFCNLSDHARQNLDAISSSATYPKGAVLFVEGQEARGVFIICNGRVKMSASAPDGKALILRITEPGEVIGIPGTISGKPYELTAEAMEPIQANFIPRREFLQFLQQNGEAALRIAELLCNIYHAQHQEIRYLGLSNSAPQKLARFILDITETLHSENGQVRTTLTLTHEEMAERIGASRETVTRLFAIFKRKGLIEVRGATLIVKNKSGLQELVGP